MKWSLLLICTLLAHVASAQFDTLKLEKFSEQITSIDEKFQKEQAELLANIEKINKELAELKSNGTSTENLLKRVEAIEKKQENFEAVDASEKHQEIEKLKVRYEAGLSVMKDIIEYLKTLKSQYSNLNFQSSYLNLGNPNTYPTYKSNVTYLKEKLVKKGLTLPDIDLKNPILNTVYTVTRSIVSDQPGKAEKTNDLTCILDFTTRANSELTIVNYDIQYLENTLIKMITAYKTQFQEYASIVGYKGTFDEYISNPNDNMEDFIKKYFLELENKEVSEKENLTKEVKFNLKKVTDAYHEYEIFIRQGLAYYEKFANILENIKPSCTSESVLREINGQFDGLKIKLQTAKIDFEDAYKGKIKQSFIKQLIEG